MNDLKILCVGQEQSSFEKWKTPPVFEVEGGVDGIVYTIPNYSMVDVPLVLELLDMGVPVFILKMRVEDPEAVRRIEKAAAGRPLYIGDQYRLSPGAVAVGKSVAMCGKVEHAAWRASLPMDKRAAWMDNYGHLTLMDLCYHYLMTLRGYIGSFSGSVYAHSYAPAWLGEDKGYFSMLLRTNSGITVDMNVNWGMAVDNGNFFGECALEGDLGRLWTDGGAATFTDRSFHSQSLKCESGGAGWADSVDGFCECLLSGDFSGLISFSQYKEVFELQHAALLSSEQNRAVTF